MLENLSGGGEGFGATGADFGLRGRDERGDGAPAAGAAVEGVVGGEADGDRILDFGFGILDWVGEGDLGDYEEFGEEGVVFFVEGSFRGA